MRHSEDMPLYCYGAEMPETELHPRPQLARRDWIDLCGSWFFTFDDANQGLQKRWMEGATPFSHTIIVPFPPESSASGIGDLQDHSCMWYQRSFRVEPLADNERLIVHFGAVDYRAQVWVNGQLVAAHEGGHTPFNADISGALRLAAEQQIVVRVEDRADDLAQPRGKQDWQPEAHAIWYHRTSGIWQPVWLERVSDLHIAALRWTPNLKQGTLELEAQLSAVPPGPLQLQIQLSLHGTLLVDDQCRIEQNSLRRSFALNPAQLSMSRHEILWSPEHPNLIEATITLLNGAHTVDLVSSYAGLRSVDCRHHRFLLNDRPYYQRLVLAQGYWPETHLAAPDTDALRREVELIKALGFNGVRLHQKVEDPRFLYWCDRLGLLVWGEMANTFVFSPTAVVRLTQEWIAVLERDYSHPCIVTWVPINESWGVPQLDGDQAQRNFVQALYHLTRALDPTRPVIGNDGWEYLVGDILGVHDYASDGAILQQRYGTSDAIEQTLQTIQPYFHALLLSDAQRNGQPVMLTEFGGIGYAPAPGEPWHGYGTVRSPEEFLAKYSELLDAVLASTSLAGFCYTQLTDTLQETNGLLYADRRPKMAIAAVQAVTTRQAQALPGDKVASAHSPSETDALSV
jgi:beta-galactosidase/beta-glucuronidase